MNSPHLLDRPFPDRQSVCLLDRLPIFSNSWIRRSAEHVGSDLILVMEVDDAFPVLLQSRRLTAEEKEAGGLLCHTHWGDIFNINSEEFTIKKKVNEELRRRFKNLKCQFRQDLKASQPPWEIDLAVLQNTWQTAKVEWSCGENSKVVGRQFSLWTRPFGGSSHLEEDGL